jgi:hypothetical protein
LAETAGAGVGGEQVNRDQELRQYLDEKFAELQAKFEGLDAKFATKEDLERVETALLTEFHKWASPFEPRQKSHTAVLQAMDLEAEALANRAKKLENRQPS